MYSATIHQLDTDEIQNTFSPCDIFKSFFKRCLRNVTFKNLWFFASLSLFLFYMITIHYQLDNHEMITDYVITDSEGERYPTMNLCFLKTKCYSDEEWRQDFSQKPIPIEIFRKLVLFFEIFNPDYSFNRNLTIDFFMTLNDHVTPFECY